MADSYIQVPVDDAGKKVDTEQITVGANTVERERVQLAGSAAAAVAAVTNASPTTEYGLVTRNIPSGTQPISGSVTVSGTVSVTEPVSVDDNGASLTVDGTVAVSSLPAIPAGTNNIGDVDVLTLPSLPAGINNIGDVDVLTLPALPAGTNNIGDVDVLTLPAISLAASAANIGDVDVLTLPATPTGDNTIGRVKVTDGTLTATVRDTGTADSLNVAVVDAAGNQITSFGGGTQYDEDTAHASGDKVTMAGVVQQAADAALSTDGDRSLLQVDANGFLKVNIKAGAGSGGTAQADESAFSEGVTNFTPVGGVLNDTITSDPTEDQAAAVRITAKRAIHVNLRDASGNEVTPGGGTQYDEDTAAAAAEKLTMAGVVRKDTAASLVDLDGDRTELQVDANGRLHVNGSGVTQPVSGTVAVSSLPALVAGTANIGDVDVLTLPALPAGTNNIGDVDVLTMPDVTVIGKAADGAAVSGNPVLVAGQDGTNVQSLKTDAAGELQVDVLTLPALVAGTANIGDVDVLTLPALPAGTNNIGDVDVLTLPNVTLAAGTNTNEVVGDAADAAAAAGNPLSMGGTARQTNRTSVSDGNAVRAIADDQGRLVVVPGHVRDLVSHQHTQIASSSAETTIVTAVASEFHDLVCLVLTNQTATAVNVTIKDSTAGTTRMIVALAANGGAVIPFPVPLPQLAAVNNNWTATLSSAAVTVNILAQFIKNV